MTATLLADDLLDRVTGPSPATDAPAGPVPAGATPAPRNFFDGCDTVYDLEPYEFPAGPPNPDSRTLADVVWAVAA